MENCKRKTLWVRFYICGTLAASLAAGYVTLLNTATCWSCEYCRGGNLKYFPCCPCRGVASGGGSENSFTCSEMLTIKIWQGASRLLVLAAVTSGFVVLVVSPRSVNLAARCLCTAGFIVTTPPSPATAFLLGTAEMLAKNLRTRTVLVKVGMFA